MTRTRIGTRTGVAAKVDEIPAALGASIKTAVALITVGVVLFGYVTATQREMYVLVGTGVVIYLLVRGPGFVDGLVSYTLSRVMRWRWCFILWSLASLFWIDRGGVSIERVITLIEVHAVGVIFYDAARHCRQARWVLTLAFVAIGVGAALALIGDAPSVGGRLKGMYGDANVLAITALFGLVTFFAGADLGRGVIRKAASHAIAFSMTAAIVASSSLTGIAGLLFLWVLGLSRRSSRGLALAQVALAGAAGGVLIASVRVFRAHWEHTLYRAAAAFVSLTSGASFGESFVKRGRFLREGIDMIGRSPIIGHGLESFRWLSGEQTYAHNTYVDLAVALGLVGVVLYYGFHVNLFLRGVRRRNTRFLPGRFLIFFIPVMLLVDVGSVTYVLKLSNLVLIAMAGWLDRREALEIG